MVELMMVIVVLGILMGLVINSFSGLHDDARDNERKANLQAFSTALEAYYSDNGLYPSLVNVQDANWIKVNLNTITIETTQDPLQGNYVYSPSPTNCDNSTYSNECVSYTLTADLEDDGFGIDDADSNVADITEKSLHNGQ